MSYQQTTLFRCDGNCVTEFQSWWIPLAAARRHAAENGWTYREGFDYCPRHSQNGTRQPDSCHDEAPSP